MIMLVAMQCLTVEKMMRVRRSNERTKDCIISEIGRVEGFTSSGQDGEPLFSKSVQIPLKVGPRQDCPSGSLLCRLHALRDGGQGGGNTGFHLTDQPMCRHKIVFSSFKCSDSWYCEHHRCVRIWVQASQGNWSRGWKEYGEVQCCFAKLFPN